MKISCCFHHGKWSDTTKNQEWWQNKECPMSIIAIQLEVQTLNVFLSSIVHWQKNRKNGKNGKKDWTYVFDVSRHRKLEFDLRYWPHTMLIHGFVQRKNDVARSWQSARRMSMSVSQFRGGVWHSRRLSIESYWIHPEHISRYLTRLIKLSWWLVHLCQDLGITSGSLSMDPQCPCKTWTLSLHAFGFRLCLDRPLYPRMKSRPAVCAGRHQCPSNEILNVQINMEL